MPDRDRSLLISLFIAMGACAPPDEPRDTAVESFTSCPSYYGCPGNAESMSFEVDLRRPPEPNAAGFAITAIHAPPSPTYTGPMQLELADDRRDMLVGRIPGVPPFTQERILRNLELIGMTLRLSRPGEEYELELTGMDWFDFMVDAQPDRVTSYLFMFRRLRPPPDARATRDFLCPLESDTPTHNGEHHHAVVFRGDRYAPVTRAVRETDEPWANIACAGTAVAKLHLLRHTSAASTAEVGPHDEYRTTVREREAMLRMLRADYCGDGSSYTVDGTPLRYADHKGWHTDDLDMTQPWQRKRLEALWSADGAVCLDTPRLVERDTIACRVPWCRDLASWGHRAHVLSANPAEDLGPPLNLP